MNKVHNLTSKALSMHRLGFTWIAVEMWEEAKRELVKLSESKQAA